jgi:hypothetical protein
MHGTIVRVHARCAPAFTTPTPPPSQAEFITAVTAQDVLSSNGRYRAMPDAQWVDPNAAVPYHRQPIQPVEVACTLSHVKVGSVIGVPVDRP